MALDGADVAFVRDQQRALELVASGAPLSETLEYIVRTIEAYAPGMRGSVLLLIDGHRATHAAAPSLPRKYVELIDGLEIGPDAGSCGTAMFDDRRVIVTDIATDPLWAGYRDAALPFGLRACWSTPLHSSEGRVLGSFAMYYDDTREPTAGDLELADIACHLSSVAVEHAWAAEQLRRRATEQAAVAALGQQALSGTDDYQLMASLVEQVSRTLGDMPAALFEFPDDGSSEGIVEQAGDDSLLLRTEVGRPPGMLPAGDACVTVDVGTAEYRWGLLAVWPPPGAVLGDEQRTFLTAIANVLAAATARTRREEEMRHEALHDPLTGLPNRALLMSLLEHAIQRARRSGRTLAVLLLDLDNFKIINDSLGHVAGDELLTGLAPRLREAVREVDTVARFGGDEFVVVAEDIGDEIEASTLADRLTAAISRPIQLRGSPHFVTASVGVAVERVGRATAHGLLRDADAAMYRAKDAGGACHRIFDAGMRERAVAQLRLVRDLREALDRGDELGLDYQRVVSAVDGSTVGAEALLRWRIGAGTGVPTADVVAAAEHSGLIKRVGAWVLAEGIAEAARRAEAGELGWLSINISTRQLHSAELVTAIARELAGASLDPRRLMLEITETAFIDDSGAVAETVDALAALGVLIALDDFGTGFSSLGHLLHFPIHALKIDRSFVAGLPGDPKARAIVAGVSAMAHELGKIVIAEGVETPAQLEAVTELGCDDVQGFLIGRPQPSPRSDAP